MMLLIPWRSLTKAASVAAAAGAAFAASSRMDCNPTVFWYDSWTNLSKKQSYYSDKCIWIIGASSGIGREIALQLATVGSAGSGCLSSASSSVASGSSGTSPLPRVVILSGRNVQKLEAVAQQCREIQEQSRSSSTMATPRTTRTTFCVVPLDVTNHERLAYVVQEQIPAMLQQQNVLNGGNSEIIGENNVKNSIRQQPACCCNLLDIVVLNSGAGHLSPALETSPSVIEKVFQTNAIWPMIFMPLLLNSAGTGTTITSSKSSSSTTTSAASSDTASTGLAVPPKTPHFIITSSIAADLRAVPLSAAYAASKAALTTYFCSLSAERPDLVLDMCLPGPVDTDFHCHHISNCANGDADDSKGSSNNKTSSSSSSSPLKMSVQRCSQLILSAASMRQRPSWWSTLSSSSYRHIWIAPQPVLSALYLNQWMPSFLLNTVFARMGPKRIAMWEAGLDLYNPQSWLDMQRQQQQQQQQQEQKQRQQDTTAMGKETK